MATATATPRGAEIKLEYGQPARFALKFNEGKNVDGRYGPRVMFTTTDDEKLWLDQEDGSDLEGRVRELGIRQGELIMVTKVRLARGGGHALRVERAMTDTPEPRPDLKFEAQLRGSIDLANRQKAAAGTTPIAPAAPSVPLYGGHGITAPAAPVTSIQAHSNVNAPPAPSTATGRLMACFMQSIDAIAEAQQYANRRGLGITFSSEDVRATAISCWISVCKEGGGR